MKGLKDKNEDVRRSGYANKTTNSAIVSDIFRLRVYRGAQVRP